MATKSNETTLLPCPFCGSEGENGHTAVWWVSCTDPDCGAEGPTRATEAEAAAAWNDATARSEQA